MTSMIK